MAIGMMHIGGSSALPGEKGYSPLSQLNYAKWNANVTPRILKSAAKIIDAQKNGELSMAKTNIVINSLQFLCCKHV